MREATLGNIDPQTMSVISLAALGLVGALAISYLFLGNPAKIRRAKIKAEDARHQDALAEIRRKYGRLGATA